MHGGKRVFGFCCQGNQSDILAFPILKYATGYFRTKKENTGKQLTEIGISKHVSMDIGGVTLDDHVIIFIQVDKGETGSFRPQKPITIDDRQGRF